MTNEEAKRYIKSKMCNGCGVYLGGGKCSDNCKVIEAINTLEQEPKTGHWIVDSSVDCYLDKANCHCSECGKKKVFPADYDHIKQELSISYKYPEFIDNFCPNCGAKIKGEITMSYKVEISESEE